MSQVRSNSMGLAEAAAHLAVLSAAPGPGEA